MHQPNSSNDLVSILHELNLQEEEPIYQHSEKHHSDPTQNRMFGMPSYTKTSNMPKSLSKDAHTRKTSLESFNKSGSSSNQTKAPQDILIVNGIRYVREQNIKLVSSAFKNQPYEREEKKKKHKNEMDIEPPKYEEQQYKSSWKNRRIDLNNWGPSKTIDEYIKQRETISEVEQQKNMSEFKMREEFNPLNKRNQRQEKRKQVKIMKPMKPMQEYKNEAVEFTFNYFGVGITIAVCKFSFLQKDILVAPFTSLALDDQLLSVVKKYLQYDLEQTLKSYNANNQIKAGDVLTLNANGIKFYKSLYLFKAPTYATQSKYSIDVVKNAIQQVFQNAHKFGHRTIVFPGFNIAGLKPEFVFELLMMETIRNIKLYSSKGSTLITDILFCSNQVKFFEVEKKIVYEIMSQYQKQGMCE